MSVLFYFSYYACLSSMLFSYQNYFYFFVLMYFFRFHLILSYFITYASWLRFTCKPKVQDNTVTLLNPIIPTNSIKIQTKNPKNQFIQMNQPEHQQNPTFELTLFNQKQSISDPYIDSKLQGEKCQTQSPSHQCQMDIEDDRQFQWRSNVMISSQEVKQRTPFALRHLTSFEEKSMDYHGKRLSQSFNQYVCWLEKKQNSNPQPCPKTRISNLDWQQVQQQITLQQSLTPAQKKLLINSAYKSTQAQLIISQIMQQIPQKYHSTALSLSAFLIKQFSQSKIKGKEQQDIINYVDSYYKLESGKIYQRLCQLGMANQKVKDHQCYLKFVRTWMEVVFLALNGVLEIHCVEDGEGQKDIGGCLPGH